MRLVSQTGSGTGHFRPAFVVAFFRAEIVKVSGGMSDVLTVISMKRLSVPIARNSSGGTATRAPEGGSSKRRASGSGYQPIGDESLGRVVIPRTGPAVEGATHHFAKL